MHTAATMFQCMCIVSFFSHLLALIRQKQWLQSLLKALFG